MIRRMKIGSQDESDTGDLITTKKTRMLMIRRMIKRSWDKSNGMEHCNNEKSRWMKKKIEDENDGENPIAVRILKWQSLEGW